LGSGDAGASSFLGGVTIPADLCSVSDNREEWLGAEGDLGIPVCCVGIFSRAGGKAEFLDSEALVIKREAACNTVAGDRRLGCCGFAIDQRLFDHVGTKVESSGIKPGSLIKACLAVYVECEGQFAWAQRKTDAQAIRSGRPCRARKRHGQAIDIKRAFHAPRSRKASGGHL